MQYDAKVWVNGEPSALLSATDRGFSYGDGFFTTMRVVDGEIQLWPLHLQRINDSLVRLAFAPIDVALLTQQLAGIATAKRSGVLKLVIARGVGGRGYSINGCDQPSIVMLWSDYPAAYASLRKTGADMMLCRTPISGIPQLAGLKTLNRLEQVLVKQEIEQAGLFEGVVCDLQGYLVECCAANLFWRIKAQVFTPVIEHAGVAGVMRRHIIALIESKQVVIDGIDQPITVQQVQEKPEVLLQADEIIISNSLLPVVAVRRYQQQQLSDFRLSDALNQLLK